MAGQKLKLHVVGRKLKKHGWAKADHHLVWLLEAATPWGEWWPKAARQYVVSARIFRFGRAMFFEAFGQTMYSQPLPSHVFSAFA
jgi:hypothetical protein